MVVDSLGGAGEALRTKRHIKYGRLIIEHTSVSSSRRTPVTRRGRGELYIRRVGGVMVMERPVFRVSPPETKGAHFHFAPTAVAFGRATGLRGPQRLLCPKCRKRGHERRVSAGHERRVSAGHDAHVRPGRATGVIVAVVAAGAGGGRCDRATTAASMCATTTAAARTITGSYDGRDDAGPGGKMDDDGGDMTVRQKR